ncbi:DUF1572 domain-containing protein [Taibaiella koreensis]|uniref:DUF1572 domain-containing protein n=1 Tax=Taibaiella koreensis TaxID=1268548 RepID=UPI000E599724|nr:DUF1572 domain-containing protein [Taibaiella koreensis]
MNTAAQIAKHLRDVHFGGNWTSVNLKDTLTDVTWQEAVMKVHSFNTIAVLVFHINYYISAVRKVLEGGPLEAKDALSFALPPITGPEEWEQLQEKTWADAEAFAILAGRLPDEQLDVLFVKEPYGNYYRNLQGIVEHTHYHLGQIVLIKKIVQSAEGLPDTV